MKKHMLPELGENVYEHILPNGLRILTAVKPGFRQSCAFFATRYGGADRRFRLNGEWIDTPMGVAHFLEHKTFDMPDGSNVLADMSSRGADANAFTASGMTAYYFSATDGFYDNLRTLLTFVSTPYYTEESVAKEQGIIAQEIRMGENDPQEAAYYQLMKALYVHHPIRDNVAGTVESIAQITPETLYACHKVFYHPSNMVLTCVGDVDSEQVSAIAAELLTAESGPVPERDYGPGEPVLPGSTFAGRSMAVGVPVFFLGVKLPAGQGRDLLHQQLLAELSADYLIGPSSSLYNDLYAKGLLSEDFSCETDPAAGTLTLLLGGESRDAAAVREAILERVAAIARRGVDVRTLEICRRARYGAELSALDRPVRCAETLMQGAMDGWDPGDRFALLREISAEEVSDFLCEYLSDERLALSVVDREQ